MIPLKDENPTYTTPYVTVGIIVFNVLVFLYQLTLGPAARIFFLQFGAIPSELTHLTRLSHYTSVSPVPLVFTPITSMFVHGGFFHLAGNMLYLWVFGNNIEDRLGHIRFFCFYLFCGCAAAAAHVLSNVNSPIPMVGASGAVAGILGAYVVLFPKAKVLTLVILIIFFFFIKIPAVVFLGIWFLLQILYATAGGGSVAWHAHIGGFLAGFILVWRWAKKGRIRSYPQNHINHG